MDPLYKPQGVEQRWQQTWEEEGLYGADPAAPGDTFVVMHPPPNISGSLTIGHCLQLALEDTLVRWHRMRGLNTLFQPGYDHAGISTWAAIGRTLAQEGRNQRDLGREGFDAYVQDWLERYGGTIMSQFRQLGASLDYRRTRFTMDEGYYRAVMRWFVHLYERGFIYRANRIVNWCPRDKTALSDLEVEHEDEDDTLSYLRYPLADGSGEVTIATVRPATILADVAVAVHPDDERYRHLVGKEVIVPFVERRVPVIADERVEPEFGTGALKVTPGHDPTDFEIGSAHGLPEPMVIGPDGLVRYHPESQHRFAIDSLEHAPDWNISRQIWWGHQVPAWYCPDGHVIVAEEEPDACAECGSDELERDQDVLDTWFSSALWPFATLGWPDDTPDLRRFYPGDFNITARDIIRLWENRMIFAGLEFMGEVPFRDVIIYSTVLGA